ncbi:MAG: hypothetical protein ACP5MT_01690 [Candidatus Acidifodinimicrobium sp.]
MGLLIKLVLGVVIGLVVLFVIGFIALSVIFPPFGTLAFKTFSSFFASPSNNNTFSSNTLNFSYPQTWVEINPSSLIGTFAKSVNATKALNLSNLQILVPGSAMLSMLKESPSLISSVSSKNVNLSKLASNIISNTDVVLAGVLNLSNYNLSSKYNESSSNVTTNITHSASSFYKLIDISNTSKLNLSFSTIDGKPAFVATFTNLTYGKTIHIPYGSIGGVLDGKNLCFVLGISGKTSEIAQTSLAFERVYRTVRC